MMPKTSYYDRLVFVDCEAPYGVGSPAVGDMTEFGAVHLTSLKTFHGVGCGLDVFRQFDEWLVEVMPPHTRAVFVSDNPAYDWQWINYYFWKHFNSNPFGHSARRIGDFYAGLVCDFRNSNDWKKYRVTPHDHNPVHDAMGNVEAFNRIIREFASDK